jgi:NitT/TauT family transport system substrate-binding protein
MTDSRLTDLPLSHRRQWLMGCSALAACLSISPLAALANPDKTRLSLVLDDRASLSHLPLLLAEQLGFFKAEGLTVEFVEQASQTAALSALTQGSADVLCASYDNALLLKQKGFDAVSIVQIARTPQWALGISNKNIPNFKTMADLRGKRIGLLDEDGAAQRCLSFSVMRSGLGSNDIQWVYLNSSLDALEAVRSGSLDALFASDPLMTALEKKDDLAVVRNFRTLKQTQQVFGGLLPGNCLIVSNDLAQENPFVCQALVSAVVRFLKWLKTAGPSDLLRYMVDNPVVPDRLVYLNAVDNLRESFSLDGLLTAEAQQVSMRMLRLLDPNLLSATLAWQGTARNDFVRAAKQRFRI